MTPATLMLELQHVSKHYGASHVLNDVDLTLAPGEIHALVGLNGAGKTTLLRLLLGITHPSAGRALVRGRDVRGLGARDWAGIGHLIENALVYPELTVEENLRIAGRLAGLSTGEASMAANERAEEFFLNDWWTKRSRILSLGNRQRLGLAVAFIANPQLVILDEPTNALDPAGVLVVRRALLDRVRENGMSVLLSSHHLDEVARIADRITVINSGRIIGTLEPDEVDIERRFFSLVYADTETRS